uniref:Major facilitator superfamily (MFS) profile domain-containing protein n=1 Tax=Spongospora subterranea TaxID=70186 RepID=A0A0H5R6C6_9EUKA|eukprot:CRZ09710.1 hypothetical protein [Spongospora subterranea]
MGSVGSPSFNHPVNVPVLSSQRTKISVSLSEALEKATFGKYQRRLMVLTGLASAGDAMEALLLSFLVDEIRQDMEIDNGFIGAAMFVGVLLGNLASGVVSDSLGRWVGFFSSTILIAVFGLLSAFSPTAYWLCILRFFVGVGLGGGHVAFTLFTEFLPARNRGKILLVNQLFWSGGAIFQVLIACVYHSVYGIRFS